MLLAEYIANENRKNTMFSLKSAVLSNQSKSLLDRVHTDLEKSLNLTLVLEDSWNLKKVSFVPDLSWNFVKLSLKI